MHSDPLTEQELVRRCLEDEEGAWDALVGRLLPLASNTVRATLRRFGAVADLQGHLDILQDVWMTLIRDDRAVLKRVGTTYPLRQVLVSIAISRTIDHLRKRRGVASLERLKDAPRVWKKLSGAASGSLEALGAEERRLRLVEALDRLRPVERTAVRLFYWQQLPARGIARSLKLRPGAVRTLLTRCRQKLRALLHDSLELL